MSLVINNNMMAANAARNLGAIYNRLSTSTQRLSSGLRINSAADDAAGLAIREMMRADIAVTKQGIRNAADAVSMIQTADGALAVIDEKLTRMKELAEQAATGTYTTVQRDIINSEYQAMAREIDRIANATNFNGIKLLDGSISNQHGGQGLKVHFGLSNNAAEDYYFINIGDARATSSTGLRVGGDAKNDIWGQGAAASAPLGGPGCCTAGFPSLDGPAGFVSGSVFSYGYNWDWREDSDPALLSGKYTAGMWSVGFGESLQNLVDRVNLGTQSRVGVRFEAGATNAVLSGTTAAGNVMSGFAVCVGNETYYWGDSAQVAAAVDASRDMVQAHTGDSAGLAGKALTSAINNNASSQFWAMWDSAASTCYVFVKEGGDNNDLLACERVAKGNVSSASGIAAAAGLVSFENVAAGRYDESGTSFSLGGEFWGTMRPVLTKENNGNQVWNVRLEGRDVGRERDLWIANIGSGAAFDFNTAEALNSTYGPGQMQLIGLNGIANILGMDRESFVEIQNAADGDWKGAEIRSQSSAQEALDALTEAITKKDKIRADLGAMQNRLENTMTNLEIQAENLQASESRISDVDVAIEMTEFTRNNILSQAATSMLAQANSITQLALSLLG
ncbi:MAG: flagellin [Candidatus Adiutrix sp.]|jgi:flagellin|nr:flagellin [Candidatus Adiutrix sp.]